MPKSHLQFSLLQKFTLLSFGVTAAIAVTLGYLLQQQLVANALQHTAARAADHVAYIVTPYLTPSDLEELPSDKRALLDQRLGDIMPMQHIVRVKIWNRQSVLIYSDEKDLIGRHFPTSEELEDALAGKMAIDVSALAKPENASERGIAERLMEVYVPIVLSGAPEVLGAYEIYSDLSGVTPELAETQRLVFGGLGGGFLVLYVLLFAIVRDASRNLIRRNQENESLYRREQARARQMQVLIEAGRQMSSILEPGRLLDEILRLITERFNYDRASINLLHERRIATVKLRGYPSAIAEDPMRLPQMEAGDPRGVVALTAATGMAVHISDVAFDSRHAPYSPDDPTRSEIGVPMLAHNNLVGVIGVASNQPDAFTPSDIAVLELLAAQAAIAVENARLYEDSRRNLRKLSALRSIDHAISATLELRRTLGLLLEHAIQQIGARNSAGLVLLRELDGDQLTIAATRYLGEAFTQQFKLRVGESISGRVAADGRARTVTDLRADPRVKFSALDEAERLESMLATPIRAEGDIIGVLTLYTRVRHKFSDEEIDFFVTLGGQAAIAVQNAQLFERTKSQAISLAHLAEELEESYTATLAVMSAALDARDRETEGHSQRAAELTCQVARTLGIIDRGELLMIERGALLHDIGKIGISDTILLKPSPLSPDEQREMQKHPEIGAAMLRGIKFLEGAIPIVLHHQERWDGTGYPHGLTGSAIPLPARIFAVVDVYDALTSDRPYRKAQSHAHAMAYICDKSGIEFDPRVVEKFEEVVRASGLSEEPRRAPFLVDRVPR